MYINVAVHYVRPKQVAYVRDALQAVILEVIGQEELDLETNPAVVRISPFSCGIHDPYAFPSDIPVAH